MDTIKEMLEKYKDIAKRSEYASTQEVVNDLYQILRHQRLLRIPKKDR